MHIATNTKLIKIGSTGSVAVEGRLKTIFKGRCKETVRRLELPKPSPEQNQVDGFYMLVETLAHKELDHFRYDFVCACGTKHKEYYRLDLEVGQRVVNRWASFSARAFTLLDGQCQLTAEWKFHLDRFRERMHGRPGPTKPQESMDDHVSRHKRWESLLTSSWWGYFRHRAWETRWQAWSLFLALWVFSATLTFLAFMALVVTVVFVYLDSSSGSLVKGTVNYYLGGTAVEELRIEKMDSEEGGTASRSETGIRDMEVEDDEGEA